MSLFESITCVFKLIYKHISRLYNKAYRCKLSELSPCLVLLWVIADNFSIPGRQRLFFKWIWEFLQQKESLDKSMFSLSWLLWPEGWKISLFAAAVIVKSVNIFNESILCTITQNVFGLRRLYMNSGGLRSPSTGGFSLLLPAW